MAADSFRFLDLPPEIRNRIYTSLMAEYNRVVIEPRFDGTNNIRGSCNNTSLRNLHKLLTSCTQLESEVAPIVYGAIDYTALYFYNLVSWLFKIGANIQYVRNITILQWNVADARIAFNKLIEAKNLVAFELMYKVRRKMATQIAPAIVPLVRALQESNTDAGAETQAFGVVRAVPNTTTLRWHSEAEGIKEKKEVEDYNSALQAELRRLMA